MDERHDTPCGTAIKKLCERACEVFGETEYTALASISVSHLYNLRKSTSYAGHRRHFEKTQSKPSKIGERRKPQPNGKPGYIRGAPRLCADSAAVTARKTFNHKQIMRDRFAFSA